MDDVLLMGYLLDCSFVESVLEPLLIKNCDKDAILPYLSLTLPYVTLT